MNAAVCTVFPRPMSSAKMPFTNTGPGVVVIRRAMWRYIIARNFSNIRAIIPRSAAIRRPAAVQGCRRGASWRPWVAVWLTTSGFM
jgi:hypothetical protein